MSEKRAPNANFNTQPGSAPSTTETSSNAPFTPRSTTFPDEFDSDNDVFKPTPLHSPGGPRYDDLPPTYDEAQQQAAYDARNGFVTLNPNDIDVERLQLNEGHGQRIKSEEDNYKYRVPENKINGSGLSRNIPVQHTEGTADIPVGGVTRDNIHEEAPLLLERALEFTRHEPNAEAMYSPMLTRLIAIPQEGILSLNDVGFSSNGAEDHVGSGRRMERHRQQQGMQRGGLPTEAENTTAQFLRAYATNLNGYSVRRTEFIEFLDGLNALCLATDTSSTDIATNEYVINPRSQIVYQYMEAANQVFFALRGLKVSLRSLPEILDMLQVPDAQRIDIAARMRDPSTTAHKRAQALHPWIEDLNADVSSPNKQTDLLFEISRRIRRELGYPPVDVPSSRPEQHRPDRPREYSDPPHSIPEPSNGPGHARNSRAGGRGSDQAQGLLGNHIDHDRGPARGPFGRPGFGPFGAPGNGPFGAPENGPFGLSSNGPFRRIGNEPLGSRLRGCHSGFRGRGFGVGRRDFVPHSQNGWESLGQELGRWGEGFGKRMGQWGQQFGRQASAWGEGVSTRTGRGGSFSGQQYGAQPAHAGGSEAPIDQETGTHYSTSGQPASSGSKNRSKGKKPALSDVDDDDTSSQSSDSDSSFDTDMSDSEAIPDPNAQFIKRVQEINSLAEQASQEGKKPAHEIDAERAAAMQKAEHEKSVLELKIHDKRSRRDINREFREKKGALRREHGRMKDLLRAENKGKGCREWREEKRGHRERKRALRREMREKRRSWKEERVERRRQRRGLRTGGGGDGGAMLDDMVWVVVENLGT